MLTSKKRFIVLTCRDIKTDFRWPLAEALRAHHETWYIWLRRRPRVLRPEANAAIEEMTFGSLLKLLMRMTRADDANIYLNSTNTSFPFVILMLRGLCGRGLWCLDMHDDLLYDYTGYRRARAAMAVRLQTWVADIIIRAAESLKELFPKSRAFGNASQIGPIERAKTDYESILVLASLDSRFDFNFMAMVAQASSNRTFHIHGQVSRGDAHIRDDLTSLCDACSNVVYHGAYGLADLETIIRCYSLSLAPYKVNSRLTRYIDPLRFYHCLNSGMELITTSIPQAECLERSLHVVHAAVEVESILIKLETQANSRRNTAENYQPQTWRKRAEQLVEMVSEHPTRMQAIYKDPSLNSL